MTKERRLGMGLEALLGEPKAPDTSPIPPHELDLAQIHPNPFQPRAVFDDDDTKSLADSIRRSGLLQPVIVRPVNSHYELVAGERRFRAARLAGLTSIPALVRDVDDKRMLELALVENLQRRDLNPIEKARAFRQLMQANQWTQEELAASVGMARPSVANFMRLLELAPELQEAVSRGTLSMGHARALLGTSNVALQVKLFRRIVAEDLPVREVERLVAGAAPSRTPASPPARKDPYIEDLERKFADFFGTKVTIATSKRGGQITVEWYGDDQFRGILARIGVIS